MTDEPRASHGPAEPSRGDKRPGAGPSASVYAGAGLQFAISILVFLFVGQWADRRLGTGPWLMMIGLFLVYAQSAIGQTVVLFGAILFSAVLLFQVITLPVEFDASARAKKLAFEYGLVLEQERVGMAKVLNAAALTYVAAAVSTLMTLLYFLFRAGLLGGSSRD